MYRPVSRKFRSSSAGVQPRGAVGTGDADPTAAAFKWRWGVLAQAGEGACAGEGAADGVRESRPPVAPVTSRRALGPLGACSGGG